MRTDNDLKAAFTTLADRAPTPQETDLTIPVDEQRPVRRRTQLRVLVPVVAATVLAAVAVPVTIGRDTAEPPVRANPLWRYSFELDLPTKQYVTSRLITRHSQLAMTQSLTSNTICDVSVFAQGVFDDSGIPPNATPVTVRGKPGVFATFGYQRRSSPNPPVEPAPRIAWQYDTDSWAVAECMMGRASRAQIRAAEQQMANAVVFTTGQFRTPFRIGHVPTGFIAESASYNPSHEGQQPADEPGVNTDGGVHLARAGDPNGGGKGRSIPISLRRGPWSAMPTGSRQLTISGLPAWVRTERDTTTVVIRGTGYEVALMAANPLVGTDEQELLRIAEGLELAPDPLDESTWFDGTVAIP